MVILRATPTALTASTILHHISFFFFWFVTLFVSLLCIIERFSSTFSVKMAISDVLKFCLQALHETAGGSHSVARNLLTIATIY